MARPEDIISSVRSIPPLSPSALQLLSLIGDPDHGVADVIRVVEQDPGLTANVLKAVNSAAYSLEQKVTTLLRAVSYLGEKMVAAIALWSCAPKVYQAGLAGYVSERGELWRHSICTAIACRELAEYAPTGSVNPELAFTAGILHDIGKAVLSEHLQDDEGTLTLDPERDARFLDVEKIRGGIDHAEVGHALARHWKLPAPLAMAIRHHHIPHTTPEEHLTLVYTVHLGDILAMMAGAGTGADTLMYTLDERYTEHLTLSDEDVQAIFLAMETQFEQARTIFS